MTGRRAAALPDDQDRLIIELLRAEGKPVSGEILAGELGMSRVALWKRIQALSAWGYDIQAAHRGYELAGDDGIAPWELDAPGWLRLFASTGSTMDEARAMAVEGAPNGSLALAREQKAGRNRDGSPWLSPPGGLYCSMVLRSALPPSHVGALALESASALLGLLAEAGIPGLEYRWPSALVHAGHDGEKRCGGILVEFSGSAQRAEHYIVGIGLNLRAVPASGKAICGIGEFAEEAPRRAALAVALASRLASWAERPALLPGRWLALSPPANRELRIRLWDGSETRLLPAGFNERGELVPARGGAALSIGECAEINTIGASS